MQFEVNYLQERLMKKPCSRSRQAKDDFDPSSSGSDSEEDHDRRDHRNRRDRRSRSPPPPRRRDQKDTPVTQFTDREARDRDRDREGTSDHDARYPNISDFHGNDGEDLEQWIASAETKFSRSWKSFPNEWTKVEYLRGYCKDAAYNAIRLHALPQSHDKYTHRQALYDELNEHFGVRDKQKVALNKVIHGKIKQGDDEPVGT